MKNGNFLTEADHDVPASDACGCDRNRGEKKNLISFIAACIFVPVYAYSHIDMSHHFLSDVCLGTLIGYLICAAVSEAFLKAAERNTQN